MLSAGVESERGPFFRTSGDLGLPLVVAQTAAPTEASRSAPSPPQAVLQETAALLLLLRAELPFLRSPSSLCVRGEWD